MKRWRTAIVSIFGKKHRTARHAGNLAMNQVLKAREVKKLPTTAQIKYLPKILSGSEKKIALGALLVLVIAAGTLTIKLLYGNRIDAPALGGEYTEGLIGSPQLINPLYSLTSDVDTDLTRLVYSGIMKYDMDNGLVYDLADSVEISDDETIYTVKIKDDANWHDGRTVLADDIVFTFSAIQNPDYRSPLQLRFTNVSVEQIDDKTVQFTLDEPFAPFLSLLTVGILPSHIWESVNPINAALTELNKKPVGSGPYKFEKLVRDSTGSIRSYTLTANRDYYFGSPNIEFLTFKFYPDVPSGVDAVKNHNIEGLSYLPLEYVQEVKDDSSLQILFPTLPQYTAAFFNQENQTILADSDVREALALATNKNELVTEAIDGHGKSIDSFILEGMVGEYEDIKRIGFDLSAAKAKLEEAGWVFVEGSEIRQKDEVALELEITSLDSTDLVATAEVLAEEWSALGIQMHIRTVSNAEFQNEVLKNRDYEILLSGELYGVDADPYAFWHSSQTSYPGLNLSGLSNRDADEYIETGRSTTNENERAEAYRGLQDIVAEEVSAIFLYQPFYAYVISQKIQNVEVLQIITPADRFSRVHEWYIKTKKVIDRGDDEVDQSAEEVITDNGGVTEDTEEAITESEETITEDEEVTADGEEI
ncbi:MAG: peptide ABC transporter substrate-binding protein [Candidatus Uhrbacteria bacterium]|nr:peptide ABC transporter substrate-binding protein [Candidatus Uhrbacteria bacterium]